MATLAECLLMTQSGHQRWRYFVGLPPKKKSGQTASLYPVKP